MYIYNKGRVDIYLSLFEIIDWFWVLFFHDHIFKGILIFYLFLFNLPSMFMNIVHSYTFQTDVFDKTSNVPYP